MAFTKDDFLPCVKEITCTLGLPVLRALDAVVQLAIIEINTQLAAIAAQLIVLDIAVAPVNLALNLAEEAINAIKAPLAQLMPVSTMKECVDMGDLMVGMDDVASRSTAAIEDFRQDAIRTLSIRDELAELQNILNANLLRFEAFSELINDCIVLNQ